MRRRLNVPFLGGLLAAVVVLGVGVYFLHGYQVKRNAGALLEYAHQAEGQFRAAQQEGRSKEAGDHFNQAVDYLDRYLALRPKDTAALAEYGLLLNERASQTKNPRLRESAFFVLERVVQQDPDRADVRREVVRVALDPPLERYKDARAHLEVLLKAAPADSELEYFLGRCQEGEGQYKEAKETYQKALQDAQPPKPTDYYLRLADLLQRQLNEPNEAVEKVMDDLVAANGQALAARLARARYHFQAVRTEKQAGRTKAADDRFAKAAQDVNGALELAADDADALLLAADLAQAQEKLGPAREYLERGIKAHPDDPRLYRRLAQLERQAGRRADAVTSLRLGLQALPEDKDLLWNLADLLSEDGASAAETAEVVGLIGQQRKAGTPEPLLGYLEARLALHQARWAEAVQQLKRVEQPLAATWPQLAPQVQLLLGRAYQQLGDTDLAYEAYRRAVAADPLWVPACLGLGSTLVALGKTDEALETYRKIVPQAPHVRTVIARLLILRNQRLPPAERAGRWEEVDEVLRQAEKAEPDSAEVQVLRAELLAAQGQLRRAQDELKEACARQPKQVALWTARAALAQRQDPASKEALAVVAEAEKHLGDRLELRLAQANYWAKHGGAEARQALARLEQDRGKFPPEDQRRFLGGLAAAYLQAGAKADAERLWSRLAGEQPQGALAIKLVLFDLAVEANKEDAIVRTLQDVRDAEGEDGTLWRYGRACYLLWRAECGHKDGLGEARTLLADLAARRPSWARVPLIEARLDEAEANPLGAIKNYQRALALGERDPQMLRRLLHLLYASQRYVEAEDVVRQLPEQAPVPAGLRREMIDISLKTGNYARALELAEKAVQAGSKDYHDYLWYAQVLFAKEEHKREAGPVLRQAVELAGNLPEPWVALVHYLAQMGQPEQATAALQEAQRKLPPEQAPVVLAQGKEALGRLKEAEKLYQAALAAKPEDVPALRRLAEFYVRTNRLLDARPPLEKLIALTNKDPKEAQRARKTLAIILATAGNTQQKRQALELLKNVGEADPQGPPSAESVEDLRARAVVLAAQRGREERRRAIGILEVVSGRQPSADDQFLLAQLYESVGNWPKAHERLLGLLGLPGVKPAQVAYAARRLLYHDAAGEAAAFLTKLKELAKKENLDPQALVIVEIEARVQNAQGQGEEAAALLKKVVEGKGENAVAAAATLLEEFGRAKDAEAMYRKYVALAKRPESALLLAQFLGRQNRPQEALELCERAWPTCSAALVAEASTAVLSARTYEPRLGQRVEPRLQEALKKHPEDAGVLLSLAELRNLQGRYPEAESIYRQVLEANPRNVVALNNLAWLLAQQPEKAGDEALELINRAIESAGPLPSLLDTRAVIYRKLGQGGPALLDLEEAIAAAPSAAKYFHRAQAYQLDPNRKNDALDALRKAKALVRKGESIDPLERKAYDQFVAELDPK